MEHIQKVQIESVGTRYAVLDLIKWIAIITMVLDHISLLFPDQSYILRSIGRWAFPLFCLILAFNTHTAINLQKINTLRNYFKNLVFFSVVSEIPYQMYISGPFETLNVMPTLLLGFMLIVLGTSSKRLDRLLFFIVALITAIFSEYIMYGIFGVALIVIMYFSLTEINLRARQFLLVLAGVFAALSNLTSWFMGGFHNSIETYPLALSFAINSFIATVIGCVVIKNLKIIKLKFSVPKTGKWVYLFYPVHLLIIYGLSAI